MRKLSIALVIAWVIVAQDDAPVPRSAGRVALAQAAPGPALDRYGGSTRVPCKNKTGHFILTKVDDRWSFCTPAGHAFMSMSVGNVLPNGNPTKDCQGANTYDVYLRKYGDTTYNWAWQTLRRMTSWGFNSVGQDSSGHVWPEDTCSSCAWPGHKQPIPLPYLLEDKPAEYAFVNVLGYIREPIKDLINGTDLHYASWRGGALLDIFDPKLHQWWAAQLASSRPGPQNLRTNQPWLLGLFTDDSDFFWGAGAGPDYASGHTNANPAWTTMISSPVQTFVRSTNFQGKSFVYTQTQNYTKSQASNTVGCSVLNPCSLRDYLHDKYHTIRALNTAWGSNYTSFDSTGVSVTGELVGTGNGSKKVFAHTLAHLPVSPFSVLLFVSGTAKAGDCPQFRAGCGSTPESGAVWSPTSDYIAQSASNVNYSKGAITVTFVNPPASGAAITVNYIYGGWGAGGTGLMDENGSNTRWVGTNPFCLEGADPNYPTYFSCVGGGGLHNPVPNANARLGADLDAWVSQYSARFFKTMHDDLRAVSQIPYLGLDIIGSWSVPAYSKFLEGAAPYIDAAYVELHWWLPTPSPAAFQSAYQYTTRYLGDVPLLDFSVLSAQADSSMSCYPSQNLGDLGTQQNRGQQYYNMVNYLLSAPGFNGTYPFVGFDWWSWQDFQQLNQGLVSIHDNAYDGKEAVIATGTDPWDHPAGGEAANYGDCLTAVKQANALWYSLLPGGVRARGGSTKVN